MYHQFVRNYVKKAPEKSTKPQAPPQQVSNNETNLKITAESKPENTPETLTDSSSGTEIGSESLHTSGTSYDYTYFESESSEKVKSPRKTHTPEKSVTLEPTTGVVGSRDRRTDEQLKPKHRHRRKHLHEEGRPRIEKLFESKMKAKTDSLQIAKRHESSDIPNGVNGNTSVNGVQNSVQDHQATLTEAIIPPPDRKVYFDAQVFSQDKKLDARFVRIEENDSVVLNVMDKGFQIEFKRLMTLMKAYYSTTLEDLRRERIALSDIKIGMIAVAVIYPRTVNAAFIRAKVMNLTQVKSTESQLLVTVSDVDDGEVYLIPPQNLCYIEEEFLKVPFKMQTCKLSGLDFFQGTLTLKKIVKKSLSVDFAVKAIFSGTPGNVQVNLFARNGLHEQPINLFIYHEIMHYFTPMIPNDEFIRVNLSHWDMDGHAWVQVRHELLPKILAFGSRVEELEWDLKARSIDSITEDVLRGELHVVKSNQTYYRVKIQKILFDKNKAVVQFVDLGRSETVPLDSVFKAVDIDPNFGKLPAQAVKIYVDCLKGRDPSKLLEEGQALYVREVASASQGGGVMSCCGYILHGAVKIPLEVGIQHFEM